MASETLNSYFKLLLLHLFKSSSCLRLHIPTQSMSSSVPKPSQWLNRLRASRGFPQSDHIDLDHFLSTSDSALNHTTPPPHQNFNARRCDDDNEPLQGRDLIYNALSELFHMGEFGNKSTINRKKSSRKQRSPKLFFVLTNSDAQNVTDPKHSVPSPSPLPLALNSRQKARKVSQVSERVQEEDERPHWDLSAYSQTEVTVIDTSVPCWKFEKVLYRSKNVWKVGDKKGKGLVSSDRKKRKLKDGMDENGGDVPKKKLKKKKLKLCNSSKYVDMEKALVVSKSLKGHDRDKMVASNEKKRDKCIQVQEKSLSKKQIDESSTVILIKSIPTTNKKNVSGVSNSSVKSMQR